MYVARRAAVLSFLHLDSLFFFASSSEASKEQRGERVPMSQYLDRRSRRPVPTLRSDRQPGPTRVLGLDPSAHSLIERSIEISSRERTRAYGMFRKHQ